MVESGKIGVNKEIKMFFDEFNDRTDKKGGIPASSRFSGELKEAAALTPSIEKYITAYPLTEGKKLAVCNFLVNLHRGSRLESKQSGSNDGSSRGRRF